MRQVFTSVGKRRRIELPTEACKALDAQEGEWFLVSVLDSDCAVVQRVPPEVPDDVHLDPHRLHDDLPQQR